MVSLTRARPLRVSSARLTIGARPACVCRQKRSWNAQRHLVLDEADDEQFKLGAGDLLLLDRDNLAHAMGGVHDELAGLEALTLGRLLDGHSGRCSFIVRFAPDIGHGRPARRGAGGLRGLPPRGGLLGTPGHGGGLFGPMTRFSCHGTCVGLTPLFDGSLDTSPRKIMLPDGERRNRGILSLFLQCSTNSGKIKALRRHKLVFQACSLAQLLTNG
jgi:hypothetical protein